MGYCQSLLPPNLLQQQVYCTHIHLQTKAGGYRLITLNETQQPGLTSWKFKLSKNKHKTPKTWILDISERTNITIRIYFGFL